MKKIILISVLFIAINASAQPKFTDFTVAERDTLLMSGISETGTQLFFNGTATLTKVTKSVHRKLNKRGVVIEEKNSSEQEYYAPSMVKGSIDHIEYRTKTDTFISLGKKRVRVDTLQMIIWVKLDKFERYPLPFVSNGGLGAGTERNGFMLATLFYPKVTYGEEEFSLAGSGNLQFRKKITGKQRKHHKTFRGAPVKN